MLDCAPKVERIVLLSGDGDFALLLDTLRVKYQVTTEVYGVRTLTADSLIDSASFFNEITETLLI